MAQPHRLSEQTFRRLMTRMAKPPTPAAVVRTPNHPETAGGDLLGAKTRTRAVTGFRDLIQKYDAFLFDQFGVLHNGREILQDSRWIVEELQKTGKPMIVVSNSSQRGSFTENLFRELGLPTEAFLEYLTSGESAFLALQDDLRRLKEERKDGKDGKDRKLKMAWLASRPLVQNWRFFHGLEEGLEVTPVEEADFVLLNGTDCIVEAILDQEGGGAAGPDTEDGFQVQDVDYKYSGDLRVYQEFLKTAAERRLPVICSNADYTCVLPYGTLYMPGGIAAHYAEEFQGEVRMHGKPSPIIFQTALRCLQEHIERKERTETAEQEEGKDKDGEEKQQTTKTKDFSELRILHIGDSLHHDVLGAESLGIDCLFIAGGVHGDFSFIISIIRIIFFVLMRIFSWIHVCLSFFFPLVFVQRRN